MRSRLNIFVVFMVASALIAIVAVVCGVFLWRMNAFDSEKSVSPSSSNLESVSHMEVITELVNMQKLVGRWLRTDSPYVIEIREVSPDGTLRAGYYNPQPINVSAAKAKDKDGTTQVLVELSDAGYPGSRYTLNYDPQDDVLEGTYFQATFQQNYNVTFMRIPAER
ncbi:MAG: hypothetical protein ACYS74_01730 [Planctomycetota bacterium]|jgi:hypothetical protein